MFNRYDCIILLTALSVNKLLVCKISACTVTYMIMKRQEIFYKLLRAYQTYYNVTTEDVSPPFGAEAEFHSHDERFFLIRRAIIDEVENNEFVYFASCEELTADLLQELDETAWSRGIGKAKPSGHHQSTDVSLIILADTIMPEVERAIRESRHTVSYRHGLHGYSNYHLIVLEVTTGRIIHNRLGYTLKRVLKSVAESSA